MIKNLINNHFIFSYLQNIEAIGAIKINQAIKNNIIPEPSNGNNLFVISMGIYNIALIINLEYHITLYSLEHFSHLIFEF